MGVANNDRLLRMAESALSRLEFRMVLLGRSFPLPSPSPFPMLEGVCGKFGSAKDTAGESLDEDEYPGVRFCFCDDDIEFVFDCV